MMPIEPHSDGLVLHVHAQPAARKNAVVKIHDGRVKIAVTQAPEKGKANQAILDVIVKSFGLRRSQVKLLNGETSSHKQFLITGAVAEELEKRLEELVGV